MKVCDKCGHQAKHCLKDVRAECAEVSHVLFNAQNGAYCDDSGYETYAVGSDRVDLCSDCLGKLRNLVNDFFKKK